MKEDAVYLTHILECIRRIEEDVAPGREQLALLNRSGAPPGSEAT